KTKINHWGLKSAAVLLLFLALTQFAKAGVTAVTVSGSTGADGNYGSLKLAFDALNANPTQTANTIAIFIVADTTETASAVLNEPSGGSWISLTIIPNGARTVSGNIAGALIDLNGADNVTINGVNAGNSLLLSNTSTNPAASTIRFINEATNNTIQNCTIQGSET